MYGNIAADHSVLNLFAKFNIVFPSDKKKANLQFRNFQRDFSFLYVVMFPIVFLYSRAVTASVNATGITSSPWGDVVFVFFITFPVTILMMIITSMFDFALSIFVGDQKPQERGI